LVRERGQTMLVVDYTGGEPLDRLVREPMEIGQFLRLSVALSGAVGQLHGRGVIHKDIKPANVLVHSATGRIRLTGFGIASRLPRVAELTISFLLMVTVLFATNHQRLAPYTAYFVGALIASCG
jgi:serine/threonine protein kinase